MTGRVERYGSNNDESVPKDILSPIQAGQREMLDEEDKRFLDRLDLDPPTPDAHDKHVPIITPEELGDRAEIELSRTERNPYLQGIAPPTTAYRCPFCGLLTAREGRPSGIDIQPPHVHSFEVAD